MNGEINKDMPFGHYANWNRINKGVVNVYYKNIRYK